MKAKKCIPFALTVVGLFSMAPSLAFSLELKEAIRLSILNSPEYQTANSQLIEAEATRSKYWGSLLPTLQGKGNFESRRDVATSKFTDPTEKESYLASLELAQPLYAGGAMMAGIELGKRGVEYSTQMKLVSKQKTVRKVIEQYNAVAELKQQLVAALEHQVRLKNYAENTGRYTKIGRSREIDNIQSQINLELLAIDVQNLQKDLETATLELSSLLQTNVDSETIRALPASIKNIPLPNLNEATERAVSQNPEVKAKQLTIEKLKATGKIELSSDMPSLGLYASAGYLSPFSSELWLDRNRFQKIGFTLTIPLFSGLTSVNQRRIQKESEFQATKDLELNKQDLKSGIATGLKSLEVAKAKLINSAEILNKSRRAFELANKGHSNGVVSSQDLISFQRSRFDSEKLAIRSRYEFEKSLMELRYLMGTDLEEVYSQ